MWVMGLWIGNDRPWARGRQRLIAGPSLAWASATIRSSADRLWLFSAFAVALLRTASTSWAACCGMNFSRAAASSTGRPLIAATTRLALRVEPRRYLAVAETRTVGRLLLQRRRSLGVLAVPAVVAGVGELAEAMADHVLGHVDRDVLLAVVDRDRVADERREDHRRARPGLDDLALVASVHLLDPPLEAELDERALLDGTGHLRPPFLLAVARADDQPPGRLGPAGPVAHRRLAPWRLGRHPGRGLALAAAVGMVARVHDDAADLRSLAQMTGPPGLAEILVLVIEVADLAHGGHAPDRDPAHLARRHPDGREVAFLGQE